MGRTRAVCWKTYPGIALLVKVVVTGIRLECRVAIGGAGQTREVQFVEVMAEKLFRETDEL